MYDVSDPRSSLASAAKASAPAATTFAGVMTGKETLQQAFTTFQGQLVSYAKAQGFTVTT